MDVFDIHKQNTGKLKIESTVEVNDREMLSQIYTPNVGKICMAIKDNPEKAKEYTIAGKTVAVISDGTAVLGFGNIGARAALPVMEGKCVIFKEFAGLNAFPICIDVHETEEIIKLVKAVSVNFAAINLEDIAAPKCFEIEKRLNDELDIPIIHDDQHGTAIVTLAALMGALKLTKKKDVKVVIVGAGAAGNAIARILTAMKDELPIESISVCDSKGLVSQDRSDMDPYKTELAEITGQKTSCSFDECIKGKDVFIGVSAANLLTPDMVKSMNPAPIIFAMANPNPEIMPDEAKAAGAAIVATGRSDFDNQINNALAYPGVFKGMLEAGVKKATVELKIAAAKAIYEYNLSNLNPTNLLPSILDKEVPKVIAKTIVEALE